MLVPAAQLLGAAFGPLAATAFVEGDNASAVPPFGIAMSVLSLALFGLFLIAVRRRVKCHLLLSGRAPTQRL